MELLARPHIWKMTWVVTLLPPFRAHGGVRLVDKDPQVATWDVKTSISAIRTSGSLRAFKFPVSRSLDLWKVISRRRRTGLADPVTPILQRLRECPQIAGAVDKCSMNMVQLTTGHVQTFLSGE